MESKTHKPTCGQCPFAAEVPGAVAQRECRGGPPVIIQHPDGSFVSVHPRVGTDHPACGFSLFARLMKESVEEINGSIACIAEALETIASDSEGEA